MSSALQILRFQIFYVLDKSGEIRRSISCESSAEQPEQLPLSASLLFINYSVAV